MFTNKNLDQYFNNRLNELLLSMEGERKKISSRGIIGYTFCGISVLLFIIAYTGHFAWIGLAGLVIIVPAIFILIDFGQRSKWFTASFKEKIVWPLIKFIDPSFEYEPGRCISENDYKNSGLYLTEHDEYEGDDYVQGIREKTFFCFSELHTEHWVSSGKSRRLETIFKGLFFIADFNKNFSGRTYVWSEENPQLNFFSTLFSSFCAGLEKVKLESIDFENRFIVYGSDQVEARYILTPSFMERLVKLENIMGRGISFSFVNTNIYAAIPYERELFEPNIFSPNDFNKLQKYLNTIDAVFTIIDELQLNQRLWSKE